VRRKDDTYAVATRFRCSGATFLRRGLTGSLFVAGANVPALLLVVAMGVVVVVEVEVEVETVELVVLMVGVLDKVGAGVTGG